MDFKTSDMELMARATAVLRYNEYSLTREKYQIRNPRRYVDADTHRRIMQEAIETAKTAIDHSCTDEEIEHACLYLYICMDARKYRLDWARAKRDLRIDELNRKLRGGDPAD